MWVRVPPPAPSRKCQVRLARFGGQASLSPGTNIYGHPIKPGIYRHDKGKDYLVLGVATHTETGEELVVYLSLYGDYRLNARPKKMFLEEVKVGKYKGPRFKLVKEL